MALSAFIVHVREAEPVIGELRERFDPSAQLGVPAHITVLYPFMSPEDVTATVIHRVQAVVSGFPAFEFRLKNVGGFPGSVYLAPEPAQPFIDLAHALARAFPDWPPYGGQHHSVVPHLTVARTTTDRMQRINTMLEAALSTHGIRARCGELELIENSARVWRNLHSFALAAVPSSADGTVLKRAAD
ncbi:MAG: 2'-5' RNA ligase family protein [Betaproteobacteria bacterium]